MQNKIFRAQRLRPLQFAAKGDDRLGVELNVAAGEIDQIIGVNRQRPQVVFFAQRTHLTALRPAQLIWLPLPRA